jgi:class 3 adenylate cyclase
MAASDDPSDAWTAAGLYDPTSPTATEQLELLTWIATFGISVEQMVAAKAIGQLGSLPADLALRPGPHTSLREIAELIGTNVESLNDIRRSSGFAPTDPNAALFTAGDVEMFRGFNDAAALFSRTELLHFTRVVGTSLRRIADAAGEMFILDIEAPLVTEPTTDRLALARQSYDAILMTESAIAVFEPMFRAQLEQSILMSRLARMSSSDNTTLSLAVGFVDLTGYTSRSQQMSGEQLLDLVLTFESNACDLVADHGGRVVKLIGDEVMFTTVDADAACSIALGLLADAGPVDAPHPRGGVAYGPVIAHGGDLYGDTVNRASRIADIAVPNEVLVDAEVQSRATAFAFGQAGRRLLKGFNEPITLWSLTAERTVLSTPEVVR